VLTDTSSDVSLVSYDSTKVILGGVTTAVASDGMFKFDSFSMTADPGTNETIYVTSSAIADFSDTSVDTNVNISLSFRYCEMGEIL